MRRFTYNIKGLPVVVGGKVVRQLVVLVFVGADVVPIVAVVVGDSGVGAPVVVAEIDEDIGEI